LEKPYKETSATTNTLPQTTIKSFSEAKERALVKAWSGVGKASPDRLYAFALSFKAI
jgi:hypothetical protein